jgi:ATP-dependent Clp protease ATP-binding subunit ClpB
MGAVRQTFKPEFLNRLDDVVFFAPLGPEQLAEIVTIQIGGLAKRLATRRLVLDVTPAAVDWLALAGFDPLYGARPLRRLIQSAIGDRLARELLAGHIVDGQTVRVDVADDDPSALTVSAQEPVSA